MAFPVSSVIETFTGADNTQPPNSSWTNDWDGGGGGFKITTNRAVGVGGYNTAWYSAVSYAAGCEAYITVAVLPASNSHAVGVLQRGKDLAGGVGGVADGYIVFYRRQAGTDTVEVFRIDNNAYTLLGASLSQEFTAGDSLGVEIIESTITVYYKAGAGAWTSLGTRSDSTYPGGGFAGIASDGTVAAIDDFAAGNVVTATDADEKVFVSTPPLRW